MMAVSGFFIKLDAIKPYLIPLTFISWFRYGLEAFMINLWFDYHQTITGISFYPSVRYPLVSGCDKILDEDVNHIACTGTNGPEHLQYNSFRTEYFSIWINLGALLLMAFLARGIALVALLIRNHFADG